jgi:sugar phosphate isomerase/epimerase
VGEIHVKISFSTIVCHEYTLPQIAEAAKRHGYDGIELYGMEGQKVTPDFLEPRLGEIRRDLAGVDLPVIHSWTYLDYRHNEDQANRIKTISKALELASKLEVPKVKMFGATPPDDLALNDAFDAMADDLGPLVKRAGELGVVLMIETHDGLGRGIDVYNAISRVDDPALGAVWDTFHPHRLGEDVSVTDELIGARTVHVHIKDNARFPGRYLDRFKSWVPTRPGEGEIPNREAVALLAARGYDQYLSVDAERMWDPVEEYDEPEVIMANYAAAMREYIRSAGA